jgi:hypothetical protein
VAAKEGEDREKKAKPESRGGVQAGVSVPW